MLYNRKLVKEVTNELDMDLASTEYKVSVYAEIASYLSDNNCSDGMNLVNKVKEEMDNYVKNLKHDLIEIENIFCEISNLIKNLNSEKKDIPLMMTVNKKDIFTSHNEGEYGFIYSIGFDQYKKTYKYGIIEVNINKGKFYKIKSKIGFSNDSNLTKYVDFKTYFNGLVSEFNNSKSIEDLDSLKASVKNELLELFYTNDLREYLINNSESVEKLTGISGIKIVQKLYQSYDINRVKIKLSLNDYSGESKKLIELVRSELSCRKLLDELDKLDNIEDKDMKDIYTGLIKKRSQEVELLKRELNMDSAELEIAISKVNSEL